MAESTLSLKLVDIQAKLGTFAGWGTDPTGWDSRMQAIIDDSTQSGLRRFYYPAPLEGEALTYDWSFLRPLATLALAKGAQSIPLPDDYGGWDGTISVKTASTVSQPWRVEWSNAPRIRDMYSVTPLMNGPPMYVAVESLKGTTLNAGQRSQLIVFPQADQAYTLQGTYFVNPDYLTGAFPYALGGPEHIETILESCLAVMEERLDDMSGAHAAAFNRRLAASIGMDRKKKPIKYGENRDRSDGQDWDRGDVHYYAPAATYNSQGFN
jgi:hypothetical protein